MFTGPDGIGDYRPRSNYSAQHIGAAASSPEATADLGYLCRAAPHAPPPTPRQSFVGEIGWGWQYNQLLNCGTLRSDMQIKVRLKPTVRSGTVGFYRGFTLQKTELRAALEDRVTHRFQN